MDNAHYKSMNRNFTAVCAALLMCAILIVFLGSFAVAKSSMSIAATTDDIVSDKVIYLTFDDGPSDRVTPKILDVLNEENVKATFFIVGKSAENRKPLVKRIYDEGHTVAVHSYSHVYNEIYSSAESLIKDIDKCNSLIREITGKPSSVYRFPGGSFGLSKKLIDAVTRHGMRYVDWNASTRDAEFYNPTPQQIYNAAVTTPVFPESIVLLAHDSTTKTATAQALKSIISYYKKNGYVFAAY